jgi:DNA processing protein
MTNSHVLLHLSLINGFSSVKARELVQTVANLDDVYQMTVEEIGRHFYCPPNTAFTLFNGLRDKRAYENELNLIERNTIQWVSLACDEYPDILRTIHMPPPILYFQGSALRESQKRLAIVGSRDANEYGKWAIDTIVPILVERGWVIVSGGARGADAFAHQAALNANGNTVVVLGSGLLNAGPPSNEPLFQAVLAQGGTMLSAFPLSTLPFKSHFPERNRIISGLSKGTFVVQAARKSGALITAQFALDDGREVFALPGPIDDPLSAGCHAIIKQGAQLVHTAGDILQVFGEQWVDEKEVIEDKRLPRASRAKAEPTIEKAPLQEAQKTLFTCATPMEELIVRSCVRPCAIDELMAITSLSLSELRTMLFSMQLEGKIVQNMMGMWEKR